VATTHCTREMDDAISRAWGTMNNGRGHGKLDVASSGTTRLGAGLGGVTQGYPSGLG
jgi:hypothetical protein